MKRVLMLSSAIMAALALAVAQYLPRAPGVDSHPAPETVSIPTGKIAYRPVGSFSRNERQVTPPRHPETVIGFEIMKYEVTTSDYSACVQDGACNAVPIVNASGAMPQIHVSWRDATAYAAWLSHRSGVHWRLPTHTEWQRAAAERFGDDGVETDGTDPAERWLAEYDLGIRLRGASDTALRPTGGFGTNSMGVADMSGNVWEWTDSCMANGTVDDRGQTRLTEDYCAVRIAAGRHQAVIIDFVRDPNVGGCAVGLPPDHLGFRLVRDR